MMTRLRSGVENWSPPVLGVVMLIIGIVLVLGGGWLIALGGSFYYLPAGIGLIIAGALIAIRRMEGAIVYLIVFLATLVCAWWEVSPAWLIPQCCSSSAILLRLQLQGSRDRT